MQFLIELIVSLFVVIGGLFGLAGSYGLIKLRDTMQRLHGPTKATTLGVGSVLIASMIYFTAKTGSLSFHELLITLFLFLTAPITANFIAKMYIVKNVHAGKLPASEADYGWAPYVDPPSQSGQD